MVPDDPTDRAGTTYRTYEPVFRTHFAESQTDGSYDAYSEAYKCGACLREDRPRSTWLEVRDAAIKRWGELGDPKPWRRVEEFVKFAFNRSKERVRDGSQGVDGL